MDRLSEAAILEDEYENYLKKEGVLLKEEEEGQDDDDMDESLGGEDAFKKFSEF